MRLLSVGGLTVVLNIMSFIANPISQFSSVPPQPTLAVLASTFDRYRSSSWRICSCRPLGLRQSLLAQPILHNAAVASVHAPDQQSREPCAGWQRYETASAEHLCQS